MSEQSTETLAPQSEQAPSPEHAALCGFNVDDPPKLVDVHVLAAIWGVSVSQIYRRIRRNEFARFKVQPAIGPKCFSGILLARYLKGEPLFEPSFGRKRA